MFRIRYAWQRDGLTDRGGAEKEINFFNQRLIIVFCALWTLVVLRTRPNCQTSPNDGRCEPSGRICSSAGEKHDRSTAANWNRRTRAVPKEREIIGGVDLT